MAPLVGVRRDEGAEIGPVRLGLAVDKSVGRPAEQVNEGREYEEEAEQADDTLLNKVTAQQDLATEFGKRTATWAGDLQEVAVDLRSNISVV